MDLWPAIDIRAGRCVRLLQGRFSDETEYGDPLEQAEAFHAAGASRLHVVDLDAARGAGESNRKDVLRIAATVGVPVQAGGGIRDERTAEALLDGGVSRVVIGTVAVEQPDALARMRGRVGRTRSSWASTTGRSPGPGCAARREVAVRGWLESGGLDLDEALRRLQALSLAGVVVTDIDRDGTGAGPDLAGLKHVLASTGLPVIASGGVAGASDLAELARLEAGGRRLDGSIVGRALLSGALSIEEAVAACGS